MTLLGRTNHAIDAARRPGNLQGCLEGTGKHVLLHLERWLKDEQDHRIFWLNTLAGTGKSTIAQTFSEISFVDGELGASFFCSGDFEDRSHLQAVFPALAVQLAHRYPQFQEQLLLALRDNPGVGRGSLCSQMEKIIVEPLKATRIRTLIIVDALDECKGTEPTSAFLSVLSCYVGEIPQAKFFITSRPASRVHSGFQLKSFSPIAKVLRLYDFERSLVDNDIKLFFRTRLTDVAKTRGDPTEDWPSSFDIDILCKKAAGLFVYASTAVKFVASEHHTTTQSLSLVASLPCPVQKRGRGKTLFPQSTIEERESSIDDLYTQVLEQAFHNARADNKGIYGRLKSVVAAVSLIFNPLPMNALSNLLGEFDIPAILRPFHSLLLIPNNGVDPILAFHKSFPDFLTDPGRCKDERFFIDPSVYHREILLSCLDLMKGRLKKDICNLGDYASLDNVEDLPIRRKWQIGDALEYACRFWANHLVKVPSSGVGVEEVHKEIGEFFETRLLSWTEVLIVMGNLDATLHAINHVRKWYISVSCGQFVRRSLSDVLFRRA